MKRYHFSSSFLGGVLSAKIAFSERSWPYLAACAVPWLLCAGQRCVTRLAGLSRLARQRSKFKTLAVAIYGKTVTLRLREMVAWWTPRRC